MSAFIESGENPLSLYIHIPFCKSKCRYCDFNSYQNMENYIPAYFNALKYEIERSSEKLKSRQIKTIFFGGGTPSLVGSGYIKEIMDCIRKPCEIDRGAEISIECNPGTVSKEKFADYKAAGVNRLSIGLQCWQGSLLKMLGRIHDSGEYVTSLQNARKAGFANINTDLIFGIPGQTMDDWKESLGKMLEFELPHLSCYSLSIEENTKFGEMYKNGELQKTDDGLDRRMYHYAVKMLKSSGYSHYEISNFAKPGHECAHNIVYWECREYLGFGAGAHSYFNGQRFNNVTGIGDYIGKLSRHESSAENYSEITEKVQISEYMFMGLRMTKGIKAKEFREKFGLNIYDIYGSQITSLARKGLLINDKRVVKLSRKGMDLANLVFMEFI